VVTNKLSRRERLEADLLRLRAACIEAAGPEWMQDGDTVYNPAVSPLHMHCGVVAAMVQRRFGGSVVSCRFSYEPMMWDVHIWNRLPDGTEYDLTSDQYKGFGGDGLHPLPALKGQGGPSKYNPTGARRNERFARVVMEVLKTSRKG
jgi:hypothetical protein